MKPSLSASLFVLLFFSACNQTEDKKSVTQSDTPQPVSTILAEGFTLLESNCFSCHSPNASMESRIAPPMIAIKKHYINESTTEEAFTRDLKAFLNQPTEENSKMPGAIERFGLMPLMNFSEAEISKIAHYIFNTELEQPDWFEKHYQEEKEKHGSVSNLSLSPLEAGGQIARKVQAVLGSNLKQALNAHGTEYALSFCSTRAIVLTDSTGLAQDAIVKRVSDRNRNPENEANPEELAYITATKEALSKGLTAEPKLTVAEGSYIGYYPIMTNSMCLQCHGKPLEDIKESTYTKIGELYPQDKAFAYKADELRGIWVVEMKETK